MHKIFCIFVVLVFLSGCKKPSDGASEYIGTWDGIGECPFITLTIYEDDNGCFKEDNYYEERCHYEKCGTVKVGPLYLYIGSLNFKIAEKPHRVDIPVNNYAGYYEMVLKKPIYLDGSGAKIIFRKFF